MSLHTVAAVLVASSTLAAGALTAQTSEALLFVPSASVAEAPVPPPPAAGPFVQRAVLATAGSAAGFLALGYTAYTLKGGADGCDICWEYTAAGVAGGILGAAAATTLVGGNFREGLKGSLLGAAAGAALVGILDQVADPDENAMVLAVALPHSVLTALFSGR